MASAAKIKNRKLLAKILTIHGYRNSPIEDIHASGRISDAEMKMLNKAIHSQIYTLITLMAEDPNFWKDEYYMRGGWGADWDEPEFLEKLKPNQS